MKKEIKQQKRHRRHKRIRAKIFGTACIPRLCVFRSAKHIYTQLVNDEKGATLVSASDLEFKKVKSQKSKVKTASPKSKVKKAKIEDAKKQLSGKIAAAYEVGKLIAEKALKKKIKKVVFDRGGYKYHGRVKAVAEGAREGGLKF